MSKLANYLPLMVLEKNSQDTLYISKGLWKIIPMAEKVSSANKTFWKSHRSVDHLLGNGLLPVKIVGEEECANIIKKNLQEVRKTPYGMGIMENNSSQNTVIPFPFLK